MKSQLKAKAWERMQERLDLIEGLTEQIAELDARREALHRKLAAEKRTVTEATGLSWEQLNGRAAQRAKPVPPPIVTVVADGTLRGDTLRGLVQEAYASFDAAQWFSLGDVCSVIEQQLSGTLSAAERKRIAAILQNDHERFNVLFRRRKHSGSRSTVRYRCRARKQRAVRSAKRTEAVPRAETVRDWVLCAISHYEEDNPHSRTDVDALRIYINAQQPGLLEAQSLRALTHAVVGLRQQGLIAKRQGTVSRRKPQWGLTEAGREHLTELHKATQEISND